MSLKTRLLVGLLDRDPTLTAGVRLGLLRHDALDGRQQVGGLVVLTVVVVSDQRLVHALVAAIAAAIVDRKWHRGGIDQHALLLLLLLVLVVVLVVILLAIAPGVPGAHLLEVVSADEGQHLHEVLVRQLQIHEDLL